MASAGGLSYSGLTNFGKATLPSVETWGTNMNILRDPPKSVYTRKIDKVGEDSSITEMIDESGNRACEAINVYARGVNPMVSVSYSNYGNNGGGGMAGSLTGLSDSFTTLSGAVNGTQASLPYKPMNGGAFRPPIRTQEDLLPLSRLPRVWTTAYTQPGFVDYSKKIRECPENGECMREIQHAISTNIRPTALYKIEKPLEPTLDVMDKIQSPIKTRATSGMRTMDNTRQEVKTPVNTIIDNTLRTAATANLATNQNFVQGNNILSTEQFVHDNIRTQNVMTNGNSNNRNSTSIEDIILVDHSSLPINENYRNISATAVKTGTDQGKYIHGDVLLSRVMPNYNATTNVSTNVINKQQHNYDNNINLSRNVPTGNYGTVAVARGEENIGSRNAHLNPKISAGGFDGRAQLPNQNRMQQISEPYETQSSSLAKLAAENMHGRFIHNAPFA